MSNHASDAGVTITRQMIVDTERRVHAYVLRGNSSYTSHAAAHDASFLFHVLTAMPTQDAQAGSHPYFVPCSLEGLASGHLDLVNPKQLVLMLPTPEHADSDTIAALTPMLQATRERGFSLAFGAELALHRFAPWWSVASYVMSGQHDPRKALTDTPARWIMTEVNTAAQFDLGCIVGAKLFLGNWFAQPQTVPLQQLRPAQMHVIRVINLVRRQASTAEIEEALKHDAALSFNLLRFINSAGFGLTRRVTSLRDAVMLLGLKRLFRWAALLMTTAADASVAPAVASMAIVRGRLMELLVGPDRGGDEADNGFVCGVFSLLDVMLGVPMERALAALSLPDSVTAALLRGQGPLAPYLRLAAACEVADDTQFANANAQLGLSSQQINGAHLQALAWADLLAV